MRRKQYPSFWDRNIGNKMKEFNVEEFLEEREIPIDDLTHCDDLLLAIDEAYRRGYNQCAADIKESDGLWRQEEEY